MTNTEILAKVEEAISATLTGGYKYSVPGLSIERPELADLTKYRSYLIGAILREKNGGGITYQIGIMK